MYEASRYSQAERDGAKRAALLRDIAAGFAECAAAHTQVCGLKLLVYAALSH